MTDIMALDIETSNYSWEIGGWDNKALFDTSVVATWDGEEGHIFTKEDVLIDGVQTHDLHPRTLGDHITAHVEKGGKILGHNIIAFDFPVLKQSLDCWCIRFRDEPLLTEVSFPLWAFLGENVICICLGTTNLTGSR